MDAMRDSFDKISLHTWAQGGKGGPPENFKKLYFRT